MSSVPTIALCAILLNERKNLERFLKSMEGCFDEIHLTDTGSTDGSLEFIRDHAESFSGCPVYLHHFNWVNDFSAARNFCLEKATTDYVMWADLDDALHNKEHFLSWKKEAIHSADIWVATYNYALDHEQKPIISFIRERVWKRSLGARFKYRIHEGVIPEQGWILNQLKGPDVWQINHLRDAEDIKADKSRNVKILEEIKAEPAGLDARLSFYYGKELYENQQPFNALVAFDAALKMNLEPHDRLLSYQYAAHSAMACFDQLKPEMTEEKNKYLIKARDYCWQGIILDPNRAEYWIAIADVCLKMGNTMASVPFYGAAKYCYNAKLNGSSYEGAIYSFTDCYGLAPSLQIAKIKVQMGDLVGAKQEACFAVDRFNSAEAKSVLSEIQRLEDLTRIDNNQIETDDIVFTTPPQVPYVFDEELYKTKAMGGSETALISVAKHLKQLTGKNIKVFQMRDDNIIVDSGVEYLSNKYLTQYFSQYKPKVHIAWRHNIELTKAKTYLWCHDLLTPTVEAKHNFDKILCLSQFHSDYVQGIQGVPTNKIQITRNGIHTDRFKFDKKKKDPNKFVFMSSPDRGLDRAIRVMDDVVKEFPDATLHIYYGFDHFHKHGLAQQAEYYKRLIDARPFVKYHGMVEQSKMYYEVSDAAVWLYPTNFMETSCITAMEMLALNIFPVTRKYGALKNTLGLAASTGNAIMLDHDCISEEQVQKYVEVCKNVLRLRPWETMTYDVSELDWSGVAKEWIEFMEIK